VSAILSAVLPWWLGRQEQPQVAVQPPAAVAPITPLAGPTQEPLPNFTLGAWTIFDSFDDEGHDYRGSTIKFRSQRETPHGLELTGSFEWMLDNQIVLGEEHFVAHYEAATRQLYIEGQYVNSPTGELAVGSFSARLSDDGRKLTDGTWGNTPNRQAGVPGSWNARR
jgi:hypothetical protein